MPVQKHQSVLNGALILSAAVIIIKIIGVFYKMPLTALIGGVGRGYFNSAYELYVPIYAISMAGLPIAVARLVSESVALKRYRDARAIFNVALKMFVVIGIVGTTLLVLISFPYTRHIADPRNLPAVLSIAPSLFFCCIMSVYRGYYEGMRNMKPTAMSQVFEAFTKLFVGLGIAYAVVSFGLAQFHETQALSGQNAVVFGQKVQSLAEAYSVIYPISAAGAILGVTFGTVIGALFLIILHKLKGDGFSREDLMNSPEPMQARPLAKRLFLTALPMLASALVLNITNLIDTVTIQARLAHAIGVNADVVKAMYASSLEAAKTLDKDLVKYLWGVYGSSLDFKNLIPMIILSLGVSALPALSAAWAIKDSKSAKNTVETVLRITMLVALPAGIGIAVLAQPILTLIYGRGASTDIIPIAAPLVAVYGYATALIAVSSPVTNMLQAIGRADIPLKALLAGATVKIICNYFLIGIPEYNIKAAPVGSVACYVVIVGVNLFYLLKITRVRPDYLSVFVKPLIGAALCGITARLVYTGLMWIPALNTASGGFTVVAAATIVSIGAGALVFAVSILLMRGIVREDVTSLPKGEKIAKMLEKYRLLG